MNKSIGGFVVCLLGLVACNVEHYDDCDGDSFDYGDDFGGTFSHGGSTSKAGHASTDGGSATSHAGTGAGATAGDTSSGGSQPGSAGATDSGEAGAPTPPVVPPKACANERDCEPGYNCAAETHECLPATEETCGELDTELACTHRSDCTPIYGGTNCSCGKDCECHGGEPGCVCENFQFFVCQEAAE